MSETGGVSPLNFEIIPGHKTHSENEQILQTAKEVAEGELNARREYILNSPEVSSPPPELEKLKEEILNFYEVEYAILGIAIPKKDITLVQASKKLLATEGGSQCGTNLIMISDCDLPEKPPNMSSDDYQMKLKYQATVMAHELNHTLVKSICNTSILPKGVIGVGRFRAGVSYTTEGGNVIGSGLEEGRVENWTQKAVPLINAAFPQASRTQERVLNVYASGISDPIQSEIARNMTLVKKDNNGGYEAKYPTYPCGRKLDNYLNSQIQDYDELIERARLLGETSAFAVALENRFGIGSFSEITSVNEEDVDALLENLRGRTPETITKLEDMTPQPASSE